MFSLFLRSPRMNALFKSDYHTILKTKLRTWLKDDETKLHETFTISSEVQKRIPFTHRKIIKHPGFLSSLPFLSLIFQIFTHECGYCPLQLYVIHGRLGMGLSPV